MKLENRRAIVTGAAQGLGYAIAKRLNEEGCGLPCWISTRKRSARQPRS